MGESIPTEAGYGFPLPLVEVEVSHVDRNHDPSLVNPIIPTRTVASTAISGMKVCLIDKGTAYGVADAPNGIAQGACGAPDGIAQSVGDTTHGITHRTRYIV